MRVRVCACLRERVRDATLENVNNADVFVTACALCCCSFNGQALNFFIQNLVRRILALAGFILRRMKSGASSQFIFGMV